MELRLKRYIPQDFQREFIAHLAFNRAKAENPALHADPILAIGGPAGSGKTSNTYALAEAMDCQVYSVQGKDLVAQLEGQGSALLVKALQDAAKDTQSFMPIVLVDDADLGGLGSSPNVTGTVNGEAVKGCVMGWADNPAVVTVDNGDAPPRQIRLPRRVCMVMTTNRLDHLHPPMLRTGRAHVVALDPQDEDLKHVIAGIYPKLGLRNAGNLMRKFPDQSISFFVNLKAAVAKRAAVKQIEAYRGPLRGADWKLFSDFLLNAAEGAKYQALVDEGMKILGQSRRENFVSKVLQFAAE